MPNPNDIFSMDFEGMNLFPPEPTAMQPTQLPEDSFIPQSYLNSLAGLPSLQFDNMGRMGITDEQRRAAQNQGMGDMLMGVAQGFLNLDTMAPMKGGAIAGQNMQGMLDNFSKQNLANVNATLDNKIKQLQAFGLMSDLEKGELAIKSAKMDLDTKKRVNTALQDVAKHYAPVVDFAATIAADRVSPEKAKEIQAQGTAMFSMIQRGDVSGAMELFNKYIAPVADLDPDLMKAKITQLANEGMMHIEVTNQMIPALQKQAESLGAKLEMGPDGKVRFVHPFEEKLRELELSKANLSIAREQKGIAAEEAKAEYYLSGGRSGSTKDPRDSAKVREAVDTTVKQMSPKVAELQTLIESRKLAFDPNKPIRDKDFLKLKAELSAFFPGMNDADMFLLAQMNPVDRMKAVRQAYLDRIAAHESLSD